MSHLQAERARASALAAQISDLEGALSALHAEKVLVQDRLDSYKYPVLTLPNEITSEIFIHFLPVYPACPTITGTYSPTNLTHICSQWRKIALTTPLLWRAIALTSTEAAFPRQLDLVNIWLSRSGCCPIWLELGEGQFEFFQALLPPLPMIATSMPALRHLDIAIRSGDFGVAAAVFGDAPLLRSVILNDAAAREIIFPLAQLTWLRLDRVYPSECAPVLQQTPNLIHCHLALVREPSFVHPPDVKLLHLESLLLLPYGEEFWAPELSGYLGTFVVPALRQLKTLERFLANPIDALTSFISKSGCNPREISIFGARSVSASDYRTAFPSIQLSFDGTYVGQTLDNGSEHTL
ncbi:hypothetical protein C8R46DRAFT_1106672 [Mycena filopes]|nr:hypothetical protein C8R46DRAFT_1106672 [Mycena filopes]